MLPLATPAAPLATSTLWRAFDSDELDGFAEWASIWRRQRLSNEANEEEDEEGSDDDGAYDDDDEDGDGEEEDSEEQDDLAEVDEDCSGGDSEESQGPADSDNDPDPGSDPGYDDGYQDGLAEAVDSLEWLSDQLMRINNAVNDELDADTHDDPCVRTLSIEEIMARASNELLMTAYDMDLYKEERKAVDNDDDDYNHGLAEAWDAVADPRIDHLLDMRETTLGDMDYPDLGGDYVRHLASQIFFFALELAEVAAGRREVRRRDRRHTATMELDLPTRPSCRRCRPEGRARVRRQLRPPDRLSRCCCRPKGCARVPPRPDLPAGRQPVGRTTG